MTGSDADESSKRNETEGDAHKSSRSGLEDSDAGSMEGSNGSSFREIIGQPLASVSDQINENLVIARYMIFPVVGLMAAYGLSQTPLFFRYRTVSEIPSSMFQSRKSIKGRIIRLDTTSANSHLHSPIRCYIRHLSPMERILPKSWYDSFIKFHPASLGGKKRSDEDDRQLLKVEIAGIVSSAKPPSSNPGTFPSVSNAMTSETPHDQWLKKLASQKVYVSCQLLARRVSDQTMVPSSFRQDSLDLDSSGKKRQKRPIPHWHLADSSSGENPSPSSSLDSVHSSLVKNDQVAVGRLYFRGSSNSVVSGSALFPWLVPLDVAERLVRLGRAHVSASLEDANVSGGGLFPYVPGERIVDASTSTATLRRDVSYVDYLTNAERDAIRESSGIWSDVKNREAHQSLVEEAEFQQTASIWRKLWRRLRGG